MIAWAIAMPNKLLSASIADFVQVKRGQSQGCAFALYDLGRGLARSFGR